MDSEQDDFIENWRELEFNNFNPATPYVLTVVLLLVSAVTIFVATSAFWHMQYGNGTQQGLLNIFLGMLLSLPLLTALWTVLGGQAWLIRVPLASSALLALLGVFLATFKFLDSSMPDEIPWMIGAIAFSVAGAVQIPLWIIRVWKGVAISRKAAASRTKMQFTIKQLLITTTIFAFVLPLLQWFATFNGLNDLVAAPISEIAGFCGIFIVVMAFLTLLSVLIVFSPKLRVWCSVILVVGLAAIPFVVVPTLFHVIGIPRSTSWVDVGVNVVAFSFSNAVTMIVVLSMYYAIGFRMSKRPA